MVTTLGELARTAGERLLSLDGDAATELSGAAYDSRRVDPGDLFFCIPGATYDGHDFAEAAVAAGAAALCVERPLGTSLPEMVVRSVREVMPAAAAHIYGHPARELVLVGATGTNGKTTTAYLVESILRAAGRLTGLIGTIETKIADERLPGVRTTPESVDVHRLFRRMRDKDVSAVAMEVTSHALVLGRVDGIVFDCALFTNLTQDHLDFHPDMEAYFAAKASLFLPERSGKAVVNIDDPYGRRLYETVSIPTLTFGSSPEADVSARDVILEPTGSTFRVVAPHEEFRVSTSLVGPFNVLNCLGAIAVGLQLGIGTEHIVRGVAELLAVPGRFESIDAGQPFSVVVDYAHTPDSLDNVLLAAKRLASAQSGRVIVVFGCGGDRDRGKRPLMGTAATRHSDVVIVTSDNPRREDPEAIIGQILEGVVSERPDGADAVLVDRRAAIEFAVRTADRGDVVVIAGKGHETGQEFADRTVPFDDRVVAHEALAEIGFEEGVG